MIDRNGRSWIYSQESCGGEPKSCEKEMNRKLQGKGGDSQFSD